MLLFSCSQDTSRYEFDSELSWFEKAFTPAVNQSIIKRALLNGTEYSVKWNSPETISSRGWQNTSSEESINSEDYNNFIYFDMKIVNKDAKTELLKSISSNGSEYDQYLHYCSYQIKKDFFIVINESDTLKCLDSHFERSYGLNEGVQFLTVFSAPDKIVEKIEFVYNDRLLNSGPIKFIFS